MNSLIDQFMLALLFCAGIVWSVVVFWHTIHTPISEERMRQIMREEVKKILVGSKQ